MKHCLPTLLAPLQPTSVSPEPSDISPKKKTTGASPIVAEVQADADDNDDSAEEQAEDMVSRELVLFFGIEDHLCSGMNSSTTEWVCHLCTHCAYRWSCGCIQGVYPHTCEDQALHHTSAAKQLHGWFMHVFVHCSTEACILDNWWILCL